MTGCSLEVSELVLKHKITPVLMPVFSERDAMMDKNDYKRMENIRVIGRFRPSNGREREYSSQNNVANSKPVFMSSQMVKLMRPQQTRGDYTATLDEILSPKTTQKQVFNKVGQPMILACVDGFNATVFAYGQSGSGKTYTMFGPENKVVDTIDFGLIPRAMIYLFQKLDEKLSQNGGNLSDYRVNMEMLQIYKKQLLDLLNPKNKTKLVIKTDFSSDSIYVQNLLSVRVRNIEDSFAALAEAQSNRFVASHSLNANSSRSHMLVTIKVVQRSVDGSEKISKLNFGDLAGSEDLTKALGKNPDPERRKEAIAINSSLSALTTVIFNLSKGRKPDYRNSELTHILKDSLGGNSKTVMFVACSPHIYNRNETIRTLRFAQTAKKVKNKAKVNEQLSTKALLKLIKLLKAENADLREQLSSKTGKMNVIRDRVQKLGHFKRKSIVANHASYRGLSLGLRSTSESPTFHHALGLLMGPVSIGGSTIGSIRIDEEKTIEQESNDNRSDTATKTDFLFDEAAIQSDLDAVIDLQKEIAEQFEAELPVSEEQIGRSMKQISELNELYQQSTQENMNLHTMIDKQQIELDGYANEMSELKGNMRLHAQENEKHIETISNLQRLLAQYEEQFPNTKCKFEAQARQQTQPRSEVADNGNGNGNASDDNNTNHGQMTAHTSTRDENNHHNFSSQQLLQTLMLEMDQRFDRANRKLEEISQMAMTSSVLYEMHSNRTMPLTERLNNEHHNNDGNESMSDVSDTHNDNGHDSESESESDSERESKFHDEEDTVVVRNMDFLERQESLLSRELEDTLDFEFEKQVDLADEQESFWCWNHWKCLCCDSSSKKTGKQHKQPGTRDRGPTNIIEEYLKLQVRKELLRVAHNKKRKRSLRQQLQLLPTNYT